MTLDTRATIDRLEQEGPLTRPTLEAIVGPAIDALYKARDDGAMMHEAGGRAAVAAVLALREAGLS